jgi:hypothetical protein
MLRLLIASLFALTLSACGDDDGGGTDAATIDASAPDAAPDANNVSPCEILCNCATTYCGTQFPDLGTCLTECEGWDTTVRACRIEHCGYAQAPGGAETHCPHVAGDENAVGTPAACVQQ